MSSPVATRAQKRIRDYITDGENVSNVENEANGETRRIYSNLF